MKDSCVLGPFAGRPDWFCVSSVAAKQLAEVPGLQFDNRSGQWIVHRNALPLLEEKPPDWAVPELPEFGDGVTVLRDRQVIAADFIGRRRGTLQADTMRMGKTGSCIASHDPDMGPMIVVGPLATRSVWQQWFARRWPDVRPTILTGLEYEPDTCDSAKLVFVHYDVLPHWVSVGLRRVGTLVFDEAHLLSNRRSRRTQAALLMATQAERIICATGTPLWNKPQGLHSLLSLCNPGAWGNFREFTRQYCGGHPGAHGWVTGDATNVEEFRQRLSEVMIRRVWADLLDDLVPTRRTLERVQLSDKRLRELDLIAASLSSELDRRTVVGQLARYRRLVGSHKAPAAAEKANAMSQQGPVVVWVWHKNVANKIAEKLEAPSWIITGQVPERRREQILDQWRSVPNGVLVMSLAIGQAGIDLSHSKQAIFAEIDWTPAVLGQAEMRTFAPDRADEIVYVAVDHDIDLKIIGVLADKCEQALLLGTPAADTAIEVLGQALRGEPVTEADLQGLAARMAARVRREGTTFL